MIRYLFFCQWNARFSKCTNLKRDRRPPHCAFLVVSFPFLLFDLYIFGHLCTIYFINLLYKWRVHWQTGSAPLEALSNWYWWGCQCRKTRGRLLIDMLKSSDKIKGRYISTLLLTPYCFILFNLYWGSVIWWRDKGNSNAQWLWRVTKNISEIYSIRKKMSFLKIFGCSILIKKLAIKVSFT